jgi:undecaprenyl diphosphate synthase
MSLLLRFLEAEQPTMMENGVRFRHVGRRDGLSPQVLEQLDRAAVMTADNRGLTLALAINYGSRAELTDAMRAIAADVRAGRIDPEDISEQVIASRLYTAGLPDPDLLIRTAGEMRLSNYLLWQCSYAEFYVADVCWPEFAAEHLHDAIRAYARRTRKFGDVPPDAPGTQV